MKAYLETGVYESGFPVSCFYEIDNNVLAHWHIDIEMVYVLKGSIKLGINKDYKILHQGGIAIFSSADIHYYDSTNMTSKIIVLKFKPNLIENLNSWPDKVKFNEPLVDVHELEEIDSALSETLRNIFLTILYEVNNCNPYYQLYVKGKLAELCSLLLRCIPNVSLNKDIVSESLHDIERMQQAIKYLENYYTEDISLEDVARVANLNPSYFSRIFKSYIGINFKEYISRIRVEKAENLLSSTDTPIIDICFQCGFNSVRTFNRTFKRIRGHAPSSIK
jgi:AraC-like DNA-binding protein